jgi:hypothetical protein
MCQLQQQQSNIKYDGHREPLYYKGWVNQLLAMQQMDGGDLSQRLDLLGDLSATQVERAETNEGDGVSDSNKQQSKSRMTGYLGPLPAPDEEGSNPAVARR